MRSDSPRHSCCGLIASFPGPCASSGGRLPEALFMVFQLDSKGAKVLKPQGAKVLPQASLHCCGLMVSFPGPCASSGGRLPEALFMVFLSETSYSRERSSTFSKRSSLDSPWYWFVVTEVGVGTTQSKCKFEKTFSKIIEFI